MLVLETLGWFIFSCILVSFIEHQVHKRLMHKVSIQAFRHTFEAHAITHHKVHYAKVFSDEPLPPGEDTEIRLTVLKAPLKVLPVAIVIALFSWVGAVVFLLTMVLHHWVWNKVHLEMHKPEQRLFSNWPMYRLLARHHWLHHRYPGRNFNVVFPLADFILGTAARVTEEDRREMEEEFGPRQAAAPGSY
jgi:hypothetical protein